MLAAALALREHPFASLPRESHLTCRPPRLFLCQIVARMERREWLRQQMAGLKGGIKRALNQWISAVSALKPLRVVGARWMNATMYAYFRYWTCEYRTRMQVRLSETPASLRCISAPFRVKQLHPALHTICSHNDHLALSPAQLPMLPPYPSDCAWSSAISSTAPSRARSKSGRQYLLHTTRCSRRALRSQSAR